MASTTRGRTRIPRRFLPPDPTLEAPYRLSPQLALRIGLLGALALAVFAVLFLRLWALQVLSGTDYLRAAQNNQLRTIRLEAPRGSILDRQGRILVQNRQETVVRVWPADLPKRGAYQELKELARILQVPLARLTRDVERRRGDPVTPVIVSSGVNERIVDYLTERRRDFPGVEVHETYMREYPRGMLASHLLGYVAEISQDQLDRRRSGSFRPGDRIGQAGLEAAFDPYLRGRSGLAELRVDSLGKPRSSILETESPRAGNSVRTTLDLGVQQAAERSLIEWIENARRQDCFGCWSSNGGAIVALDPRDGAVLALASFPRYDPRLYTGRVDERDLRRAGLAGGEENAKRRNYPGVNRALQGVYPAGSTWKPVTALAAMQEHLISPYTTLDCTGSMTIDGQRFNNWNPDVFEPMTLTQALESSCDTYFYQVGKMFYDLPPERRHPFQEWAARFGFGKTTGLEVGAESSGLLPTPEWRKRTFDDPVDKLWKSGDSVQLAIGQKDLLVTPLQLTRFYAMVANGGTLVTPHLGVDVEQPADRAKGAPTVLRRLMPPHPQRTGVDPEALSVVQQGLLLATHGVNGTATSVFGNFPVDIAGKTGTAEKAVVLPGWSTAALVDQSWWCGYGPVDEPELVVCAIVENGGHGGSVAAPAALNVFQEYFGVKGTFGEVPELTD